jgi:hypothetical protein
MPGVSMGECHPLSRAGEADSEPTMNDELPERISAYLQRFGGKIYPKHPDPPAPLVEELRRRPEEAFEVVVKGLYIKPEQLDFRDLDDPLNRLLSAFAELIPDRLIPKMTEGYWASRYLFITAAATSKSPLFVPTLVDLLLDRSIYIKTLVLRLILDWPHLRVAQAAAKLEKLAGMKSFQRPGMDRELLEKARGCLAAAMAARA